jgi:molecular chaperone DnaK (HSP70)
MPAVASIVQEYIGLRPDQNSVRPEDAVACGAAVQAAILQGELQAYDVFTVLEAALIRGVMREQGSQRERKRRAGNGGERARRR